MDSFKLFNILLFSVFGAFGQQQLTPECDVESDCVPYYLCKNNTITSRGERIIIDIRLNDNETPKQCKFLEICCSKADKTSDPIIITNQQSTSSGCGYRNENGIGLRIIGNENEAQYGEFPWMVAILKKEEKLSQILNVYVCGGSLIHPQVVLTAAHCIVNNSKDLLKARAGDWDAKSRNELYSHQDQDIIEIIIHPKYHKGALYNDIALLFTSQPFKLTVNINTVCLPLSNMQFDFQRCFATGWGKNAFGNDGRYQAVLKKIELPIVPRGQCEQILRTTRLSQYYELHSSFICAGGERGFDTCQGDGGSPLVCPISGTINRYHQVGIVSWGIGCGDEIPAVYTNIVEFRNWIDQIFVQKQISNSFFIPSS